MSPLSLTRDRGPCAVKDCDSRAYIRGLCNRHYLRLRRHGHPTAGSTFRDINPPEFCTVDGCGRPYGSMGYCDLHYNRWRRHGDPTVTVRMKDPAELFAARHEVLPGSCWLWTGGTTAQGYGALAVDGETILAHRYAFERHHCRPVAEGMEIHHTCRNRLCVNPGHMQEITDAEHTRLHTAQRMDARYADLEDLAGELAS